MQNARLEDSKAGIKIVGRNISNLGEGNGNPLQYSCLENPMDGGAWLATVHGIGKELDTTERLHYVGFWGDQST